MSEHRTVPCLCSVTLNEKGEVLFENSASAVSEIDVGRLFDRYFTVENGKNSTGLGLSIAKSLTEKTGGSISAEYNSGRLTIKVTL